MPRIDLTITFTNGNGTPRSVTHRVETAYPDGRAGEGHVEPSALSKNDPVALD